MLKTERHLRNKSLFDFYRWMNALCSFDMWIVDTRYINTFNHLQYLLLTHLDVFMVGAKIEMNGQFQMNRYHIYNLNLMPSIASLYFGQSFQGHHFFFSFSVLLLLLLSFSVSTFFPVIFFANNNYRRNSRVKKITKMERTIIRQRIELFSFSWDSNSLVSK